MALSLQEQSVLSAVASCASCAWYIRARRGQRINLTLFNFIAPPLLLLAPSGDSTTKLAADTCYHVGVVRIV